MKYLFRDNCVGISIFRQAGVAPTITLVSIVNITDSTATVNVSIAYGDDVSKTGVQVDTTPTFSNPISYEENGAVNTIAVDNLTAETTYYVRAYVIWSLKTTYSSNSLNFTTESSSILPAELQGVEYLQGDGNAYIDTGIIANNILQVSGKFNGNNDLNRSFFGAKTTNNPNYFFMLYYSSNGLLSLRPFSDTSGTKTYTLNANVDFTFTYDKIQKKYTINSYNGSYTTAHQSIGRNLLLFVMDYSLDKSKGKIYHIETNVFNMYPCYIKSGKTFVDNKGFTCSSGTAGMYDIVNSKFYTNDGTGAFLVGADINI